MTEVTGSFESLGQTLSALPSVAIAVSGGVDSMTLAHVAHKMLGKRARMFHAVSPAVPPRATHRVREHAVAAGWQLRIFDAGEFSDSRYMTNPVNRCFFCKGNLYRAIRDQLQELPETIVLSGTNLDDLSDYRPGLIAAAEHGVRHPFVETSIDKAGVRALALELGLVDLSELPSSPCLSSRIETGIAIEAGALSAVDQAEELLRQVLNPCTVRCRVRQETIEIEIDDRTLDDLPDAHRSRLDSEIRAIFRAVGIDRETDFTSYRRGSAFLTESAHA